MSPDVCVGGSFNIIHAGHWALLAAAIKEADGGHVFVGLSSDRLASREYDRPGYQDRVNLVAVLMDKLGCKRFTITPIDVSHPPNLTGQTKDALTEKITTIVVSGETEISAHGLNLRRRRNGLPPLKVVVVPMVLAEDEKPIHATRIAEGEIDENGKSAR